MGYANTWNVTTLLGILKSPLTHRRFSFYDGGAYSVRRARTFRPGTVVLAYGEPGRDFDFAAEEDTDGGLFLTLEEMDCFATPFSLLDHADKLVIAQNLIKAAASKHITLQILDGNRPL